ncbi:MAG: hypothetical protein WA708_05265 [Acidobacteriaceae bacterium]
MKWICLGFLFVSFATYIAAQNTTAIHQAESACGPSNVKFAVTTASTATATAAQPGKAQIYVIEDTGFENPIIRVGMDGQWTGATQGNSYISFPVEPGDHHLCANWQPGYFTPPYAATALYGFNAKPDKQYFFRVRMPGLTDSFGILHSVSFEILLERVNADEGQLLITNYPPAVSKPKK